MMELLVLRALLAQPVYKELLEVSELLELLELPALPGRAVMMELLEQQVFRGYRELPVQ